MSVTVKLANSGVVGVTNLVPAVLTSANNGNEVAVNSINAFDGTAGFTIFLPANPSPGAIVEFKNLLQSNAGGVTQQVTVNSNGQMVDGNVSNITTVTRNEVFKLIYVNPVFGWLVI